MESVITILAQDLETALLGQFTWRSERIIEERDQIISDTLSDYEIQINNLPIKKFGFSNRLEIARDLFLKSDPHAPL